MSGQLEMRTRMGWQQRWCEVHWGPGGPDGRGPVAAQFCRSHTRGDAASRKVTPIAQSGAAVRLITESANALGDSVQASGRRLIIELRSSGGGGSATELLELRAPDRERARE
jgi:hypothetical protein